MHHVPQVSEKLNDAILFKFGSDKDWIPRDDTQDVTMPENIFLQLAPDQTRRNEQSVPRMWIEVSIERLDAAYDPIRSDSCQFFPTDDNLQSQHSGRLRQTNGIGRNLFCLRHHLEDETELLRWGQYQEGFNFIECI